MNDIQSPSDVPPPLPRPIVSGSAVISLILGSLGLFTCGLTGFVGLGIGIHALVQYKSGGPTGGKGLAIAGVVVSSISILTLPVILLSLGPAINNAHAEAERVVCQSHMRQIGLALLMYAVDNDGQFPHDLQTLTQPYNLPTDVLHCPSVRGPEAIDRVTDYLYVRPTQPMIHIAEPARTIVLYERLSAHRGQGINILYVDCHVEFAPAADARALLQQHDLKIVE